MQLMITVCIVATCGCDKRHRAIKQLIVNKSVNMYIAITTYMTILYLVYDNVHVATCFNFISSFYLILQN